MHCCRCSTSIEKVSATMYESWQQVTYRLHAFMHHESNLCHLGLVLNGYGHLMSGFNMMSLPSTLSSGQKLCKAILHAGVALMPATCMRHTLYCTLSSLHFHGEVEHCHRGIMSVLSAKPCWVNLSHVQHANLITTWILDTSPIYPWPHML